MLPGNNHWMDTKHVVSVMELKVLLTAIIDNGREICIRYRLVGEMWQPMFMRVLVIGEDSAVLHDEDSNKATTVRLQDIMQFEIDGILFGYQPHNHYNVTLFYKASPSQF